MGRARHRRRARVSTGEEERAGRACGGHEGESQECERQTYTARPSRQDERLSAGRSFGGRLDAELLRERSAVGRSFTRILRERRPGQCGEVGRGIRAQDLDRGGLEAAVHVDELERLLGFEWKPAGEHPKQHDAEGVDVARRRRGLTLRLLRGDVRGRAEHGSGLGEGRVGSHPRDPEVRDLRPVLVVEEDVRRLQVAVDETVPVRMSESRGELNRDRSSLVVLQAAAGRQALFQRSASEVLERHVRAPFHLAVVVETGHVRVSECRDSSSLPFEPGTVGVRSQQLQRDGPLEFEVLREPDLAHRTVPKLPLEPVALADDVAAHGDTVFPVAAELLTREEAQERILERVTLLASEPVPVAEAAGRVLAEDARAVVDLPPFPSSAMDGFAVRAADTPARLPVSARIAAGAPVAGPLRAGEAMAIATGGVVPEGADSVIPIEYVVEHDNEVEIPDAVVQGDNIRPRGRDVAAGGVVVAQGTRLGAAQIGALAASGLDRVACFRRPRVAILATGSELRRPGEPLGPGQVYEANGVLLATALASAGADIEMLPAVADDESAHRDALRHGLEADVLVTSGGVSVGPHDLVRRILADLGVEEVFWGVAVKPGKPLAFAVRGSTLVFGLPGNPVSSLVGCELFVRPAVLALQGALVPGPVFQEGRLAAGVRRNEHRDQLLRARVLPSENGAALEPVTGQESHMIARAAAADALVLVPRGAGELAAGESVRYLSLA